jgi:glycosyltransferase involved in cell wall biosynthesis
LPLAEYLLVHPVREMEWSVAFERASHRAMCNDPMDVIETTELGSWWLARRPVTPIVVRLHGSEYTFRRWSKQRQTPAIVLGRILQRDALRRAACVTAPSRFQAAEVAREMGWDANRITAVPNAIPRRVLDETPSQPQKNAADSEAPIILYVGRLAPIKGTVSLLQAVPGVLRDFPRARFVLAGPWQMPGQQHWRDLVNGVGDAERLTWLGHLTPDELTEWYRRASVFVMPSYYETFGISCLEAMAHWLPVVASRVGGLPEVVDEGCTGMLVPPGEPNALSQAISEMLKHADLRGRMAVAGRLRVGQQFTAGTVVADMLDVYRRAIASRMCCGSERIPRASRHSSPEL